MKFCTQKLLDREYRENEISKITTEINHRNQTIKTATEQNNKIKNKLIFTTTYSPYIKTNDLKTSLSKNWVELEKDKTLKTLFPSPSIIAYERNKNLKDALVKTKFTRGTKHQTNHVEQATISTTDQNIDILASLFEEQ